MAAPRPLRPRQAKQQESFNYYTMNKEHIINTNFRIAQEDHPKSDFIANDIILSDKLTSLAITAQPRRMTFILVALCTEGSAQFTIDTQRHDVQKNDIIIISDRHVIDNYVASDDAAGLAMMLSVNFFYEVVKDVRDVSLLFLFSRNHPVVSLNEYEVHTFKEYFFFLKKKIAETDNHFKRDLVRTLVLAMFYDLSNVIYRVQQIECKRQTRADAIFTQFIKLVEDNYKHERRVSWYAEQMCITPKYLSEIVKSVSKNTPNEWIDKYVTLEARVLLKTSTMTIKEISDELHFANQSFLGKFFKEHVGMSPSAYRKQ